jgi:hypothetical protein
MILSSRKACGTPDFYRRYIERLLCRSSVSPRLLQMSTWMKKHHSFTKRDYKPQPTELGNRERSKERSSVGQIWAQRGMSGSTSTNLSRKSEHLQVSHKTCRGKTEYSSSLVSCSSGEKVFLSCNFKFQATINAVSLLRFLG